MFGKIKRQLFIIAAVIGPGLITAFADNDAGGVATYSVSASKFGYNMLTAMIPITIVLLVTQEIGARIAIVTGKGLADLIREQFGIRITTVIFFLLSIINFGVIIQNIGGLKSGLGLFGMDYRVFLPLTILALFAFITLSTYKRIERFFLILIAFYMTYFISALLSKPDWAKVTVSLFVPSQSITPDYIFTSMAVLGTTVTAWGQFFINSYIKDKKITVDRLRYSKWEIYIGAILTNLFSIFMMVAVIATVWVNNKTIDNAADAALAISPLAGQLASTFFGVGLLIAGFLGCAIVPLATAYAFSEFFGYSGSLDEDFKKSKLFYGMFILQILAGMGVVMLPSIGLFKITLYADFLNALILPIVIFFLYRFANNTELMGEHKNTTRQNVLLLGSGAAITLGGLAGIVGKILNIY